MRYRSSICPTCREREKRKGQGYCEQCSRAYQKAKYNERKTTGGTVPALRMEIARLREKLISRGLDPDGR